MDDFTKEHLINWAMEHLSSDERWQFISYAADLLQDAHDLAYYQREGWNKLYDRFFNERLEVTR